MNTRPNITISTLDAERLESLLESLPDGTFPGREALEAELLRADLVAPKDIPPTTVTMNSTVRFRVGPDETFKLTLVYPRDANGSADRISVLAPVGSALLGLKEGDTISWPINGGASMDVQVIRVTEQPERDGNFAA